MDSNILILLIIQLMHYYTQLLSFRNVLNYYFNFRLLYFLLMDNLIFILLLDDVMDHFIT